MIDKLILGLFNITQVTKISNRKSEITDNKMSLWSISCSLYDRERNKNQGQRNFNWNLFYTDLFYRYFVKRVHAMFDSIRYYASFIRFDAYLSREK